MLMNKSKNMYEATGHCFPPLDGMTVHGRITTAQEVNLPVPTYALRSAGERHSEVF